MDTLTSNASASLPLSASDASIDFTKKAVALVLLVITFLGYWVGSAEKAYRGFKLVGKAKGEWSNKPAKERWAKNSVEIVQKGLGGKPFQVITPQGPLIVLPIEYLDDVKSNEHFSLMNFAKRDFFANYPGLEVFGSNDDIFATVVRQKLTHFNHVAEAVASRLSSLVFLGRPLCRNKDWLSISVSYTINCIRTIRKFSTFHPLLRPFVFRFLVEARQLQQQRAAAKRIIEPEVLARRKARFAAQQAGEKYESKDAVSWFEDVAAGRPYDYVSSQLSLATAAIHTTSSTLLIVMYDILRHPELVAPLRAEAARVLREDGGWKKTSLYKMRLLDSVMKESVRVTTVSPFAMRRYADREVTLFDGTRIPKGAYFLVSCTHLLNPSNFGDDGDKFDGYRFVKLREQAGQESRWQFVTTGQDNMRFGHGIHACPGRFFASNEIKIAIAHLLLNYDWRFKGDPPKGRSGEYEYVPDPRTVVQFRSREPEVKL
ncbi:putative cytochrome p450 protein [Neofusicoccum parvum UCRNP2]|uniref:Putative cytochrome p450 protein n=1 Tax=Botryosphaeria parva (strain UCR-NP2) TaxID=1287680 RepID=R1GGE6_BOTPV|nr:putative cytochrome p450 protein [Neofusicoccum parvum UCRNP2]